MREIEIKFKLESNADFEEINKILLTKGAVFLKNKHQIDTVLLESSKIGKPIVEGDKIARIRNEKKGDDWKLIFTLKIQGSGQHETSEYEFGVDSKEKVLEYLEAIGFTIDVEIEKQRSEGTISGYNICLDRVEKLGNFIELKYLTEDEQVNAKEVQEKMEFLLKELNLNGQICYTTYDTMLRNL